MLASIAYLHWLPLQLDFNFFFKNPKIDVTFFKWGQNVTNTSEYPNLIIWP